MVTERGLQVLRAIVQDYVETHEPVGSRSIVDRHSFGVSAATIRNDMALLEDEELITAPHTSSGRVPTDKGYRVFVNHLAQLRPLSSAQRSAIESFLGEPADLDDLMVRTVRVLTQLTGQVALANNPSFARAHVTHVELVALCAESASHRARDGCGWSLSAHGRPPGGRSTTPIWRCFAPDCPR